MPKQQEETKPSAPVRNRMRVFPVISHEDKRAQEQARPGFVRKKFSMHPHVSNQSKVSFRTQEHWIGDDEVGYLKVAPWQVVTEERSADPAKPGHGTQLGTVASQGVLVTCELPEEEYAKYDFIRAKQREARIKRLNRGVENTHVDAYNSSSVSSVRIARGEPVPLDHHQLLNQRGA